MDPYKELGVDIDSDDKEIKKAYKKKAKETHPDAGGSDEKFNRVQTAYLVLSDPEKREYYDTHGSFDDKEVSSIYAYIEGLFEAVFSTDIDVYTDIIKVMKDALVNKKYELNQEIAQLTIKMKKVEEINKRLNKKDKNSTTTILEDIIKRKLKKLEYMRKQYEKELTKATQAITILDEYVFKREKREQATTTTTFFWRDVRS